MIPVVLKSFLQPKATEVRLAGLLKHAQVKVVMAITKFTVKNAACLMATTT